MEPEMTEILVFGIIEILTEIKAVLIGIFCIICLNIGINLIKK